MVALAPAPPAAATPLHQVAEPSSDSRPNSDCNRHGHGCRESGTSTPGTRASGVLPHHLRDSLARALAVISWYRWVTRANRTWQSGIE